MSVLRRMLNIESIETGAIPVEVIVFQPERNDKSWSCTYEINWPEKHRRMSIHGLDAIQSLILALQAIGAELHASRYHAEGRLFWEAPGKGYGFPLPRGLQDLSPEDGFSH